MFHELVTKTIYMKCITIPPHHKIVRIGCQQITHTNAFPISRPLEVLNAVHICINQLSNTICNGYATSYMR